MFCTFLLREGMQDLIDLIKADPWPFIAAGIVVVAMILSEFFGKGDGTDSLTFGATKKSSEEGLVLRRGDGEPIADVDYLQLYPRLTYARAQVELLDGDIYDVAGDGSSRDGWKMLINAMPFAERPLGNWPKDARELFS